MVVVLLMIQDQQELVVLAELLRVRTVPMVEPLHSVGGFLLRVGLADSVESQPPELHLEDQQVLLQCIPLRVSYPCKRLGRLLAELLLGPPGLETTGRPVEILP